MAFKFPPYSELNHVWRGSLLLLVAIVMNSWSVSALAVSHHKTKAPKPTVSHHRTKVSKPGTSHHKKKVSKVAVAHHKYHKIKTSKIHTQYRTAQPQYSQNIYTPTPYPADFKTPEELKPAVEFWRKTYATWRRSEVVFHDDRYLDIIYEVIILPGYVGDSLTKYQK
jgi:hypothetical protein